MAGRQEKFLVYTVWNKLEDYQPLFPQMNDEELANMAICLCHQVDAAMTKYIQRLDRIIWKDRRVRKDSLV